MRPFVTIFALLLVFASFSSFAGTTGKVSGYVYDQSTGEPLIGANVLIEGTMIGAATDIDGFFQLISVPPGRHNLIVQYVGYARYVLEGITVSVDRTTKVEIELVSETVDIDEVVVEAKRPPVQKDRTYSSSVVGSESIESMPVTSLQEVIQLQPGVVSSGGSLHFRGGRGREVAYLIDGMPVSNSFSQGGGNNVVVENSMIEEVEVISGTFNAEYGSAQSGVVNIVTKRPAPKVSGSIQAFTGEWLSSQDDVYLGISDFNPVSEKDFQFNLSGPVLGDKLGFSLSGRYNGGESIYWYERRFNPVDGWRISAYERWYRQHYADAVTGKQAINIPDSMYTGDLEQGPLATHFSTSFSGKLDYFPFEGVKLSYQMFGSYGEQEGSTSSSRRYQPDEAGVSKSWSHHHFITYRHAVSASFFFNLGFSYQFNDGESYYRKDNYIAQFPGDAGIQPISASSDGFSLGDTGGFYTDADGKNFREVMLFNGDINWQIDKYNFVKAGFEIRKHRVNTYSWGYIPTKTWENKAWPTQDEVNGADLGWNLYWDKLVDYWTTWEENFGPRYRRYEEEEYYLWRDYTIDPMEAAVYVQDKVELGEIILNAGLRLDMFMPNEKVPENYRVESYNVGSEQNLKEADKQIQLSPRLGVSFPISATGVFHAAYGHFFQMPSFSKMFNEPLFVLTPLQLEGRTLGNAELEPERTIAYEIGLQQAISDELAVDITAFYKDIKNLLGIERITTVDAIGYNRYINRDYGNVKGITLGLRKTSGVVTGYLNYSYQFANGSSSSPEALQLIETATSIGGEPVVFIDRQITALDWDQRHTLNLIVNVTMPDDWSFGIVSYLTSGQPYSPTFVDRYDIPEREFKNASEKPLLWNVDLKAQKHFSLGGFRTTLFLKIDNVFDQLGEENVFSSSGRATYNARLPQTELVERERLQQQGLFTLEEIDNNPSWYTHPRKIQLGLEFRF